MGNLSSVSIVPEAPEEELAAVLLPLYLADSEKFQRVVAHVEVSGRSTKPKFPDDIEVSEIPPVPEEELHSFKEEHISSTYLDHDDPEAIERCKKSRELQYQRWRWATKNVRTYVNVLRAAGHSDEKIQNMLHGTPMCFSSPEEYLKMRKALKTLKGEIEEEMGWTNVNFVITGSSVPGFSQNPCKGIADRPSKITNTETSDVDICIVGDGVNKTMAECLDSGLPEPKRCFPTTCTPTTSATRFGCKNISLVCKSAERFHSEWAPKLAGGLQFTFAEDDNSTPPWEARIDISDV